MILDALARHDFKSAWIATGFISSVTIDEGNHDCASGFIAARRRSCERVNQPGEGDHEMTSVCTEYAYACSYSYEYSVRVFVLYSYYTYAGWGFARRPRPSRARPMLSSHQRITRRDEQQPTVAQRPGPGPAAGTSDDVRARSELVCVPTLF